jgi:RHH-type transcriptional regulator, rel operon repressor / antitoxin RelB
MAETLFVNFPDKIDARLNYLANRAGQEKNLYVMDVILDHIEEMEDVYIAESRLAALEAGQSYTYCCSFSKSKKSKKNLLNLFGKWDGELDGFLEEWTKRRDRRGRIA